MLRRVGLVLAMLLVFETTGCALLQLALLPVQLLVKLVSAAGNGVASLFGEVVLAEPVEGPAPTVRRIDADRYLVEGAAGSRFVVTCAAGGGEPLSWRWPEDFPDAGTAPVTLRYEVPPAGKRPEAP